MGRGEQVAVILAVSALLTFGGVLCQEQEQGAVLGLSTSILCDFGRQEQAPFWFINETVYEIFTIPRVLPYIPIVDSYSTLQIPVVPRLLNNTTFRCAIFTGDLVNPVDLGTLTRLIVVAPNPDNEGNGDFGDIVLSELVVDFQLLFIYQTSTSVTWFANQNETCSRDFQIRGYTLSSAGPVLSNEHIFNVSNTTTYQLPSSQYTNSAGVSIDYRLSSITDVCSGNRDVYYYRFNGSEVLEWRVFNPNVNSTTCYAIPKRKICDNSLNFYFGNHGCPVHNSTQGRMMFEKCTRGYADNMLVPELTESGEICFSNLSSASIRNESLFHFLCSTDPCANEECLLRTIISSHGVIFAGPPSTPDIVYNGSSLCFSAYALEEFPVLNFHVEISDITETGGSYNLSRPQCLASVDLCLPVEVSISAINVIGMSSTSITLQDGEDTLSDDICGCYLRREPMEVDVIETESGSVTISLSCGQTLAGSFNYVLEDQSIDERKNFTIECGGNYIIKHDLSAATDYSILHKFGETDCRVKSFSVAPSTVLDVHPHPGAEIAVGTVIAVVLAVVVCVAIAAAVLWMRKRCGSYNLDRNNSERKSRC